MKMVKNISRVLLGLALTYAGFTHLTSSRLEFQAQVPTVLKDYADFVVLASGVVEIVLGLSLVMIWRYQAQLGWIAAAFFVAIFPGNISQYINQVDAFGLDSDSARLIRLFFQPILVIWALWSTGAWQSRAKRGKITFLG
jgi:uncharacterized membrane protein